MSSEILTAAAAGFLIGSIPFSWILARVASGLDIRTVGSGNVGATNVARSVGPGLGALALLLDAAKGAGAVVIGQWIAPGSEGAALAAGGLAVLGHAFSPFLKFRGGKGVATGAGAMAMLAPWALLLALVVFGVAVGWSRMVSLGSILAAAALPLFAWITGRPRGTILLALGLAVLVVARHRENLRRLASGTERRLGDGAGARKAERA
jgi:acyl phosphate:glycerol-3-phosphate acyltransferase